MTGLHRYSLGIVVKDRVMGEDIIYAQPYEILTNIDGTLDSTNTEVIAKIKEDGNVKRIENQLKTTSLKCKWLPTGDLRTTPPDIVAGEQVYIYRYGDEEDYYWQPKKQDLEKRRLEHIVFTISNTPNELDEAKPNESAWTVTLSTKEKHITVQTTANDGEKAAYTFSLSGKDGIAKLVDTNNSGFILNTVKNKVTIRAEEIELDCKKLTNLGIHVGMKAVTFKETLLTYGDTEVRKGLSIKGTSEFALGVSMNANLTVKSNVSAGGYSAPGGLWHFP